MNKEEKKKVNEYLKAVQKEGGLVLLARPDSHNVLLLLDGMTATNAIGILERAKFAILQVGSHEQATHCRKSGR